MEPLPEPVAPLVTVIQSALLAAVHAHPVDEVTLTVTPPPLKVRDALGAYSV